MKPCWFSSSCPLKVPKYTLNERGDGTQAAQKTGGKRDRAAIHCIVKSEALIHYQFPWWTIMRWGQIGQGATLIPIKLI